MRRLKGRRVVTGGQRHRRGRGPFGAEGAAVLCWALENTNELAEIRARAASRGLVTDASLRRSRGDRAPVGPDLAVELSNIGVPAQIRRC